MLQASHLKAGGWSKAARAFREVLGDAPEHAPALYGLGLALARGGLSAEAERALASALDHWPDWPRCREALAAARGARADSTRRP